MVNMESTRISLYLQHGCCQWYTVDTGNLIELDKTVHFDDVLFAIYQLFVCTTATIGRQTNLKRQILKLCCKSSNNSILHLIDLSATDKIKNIQSFPASGVVRLVTVGIHVYDEVTSYNLT